MNDASTMTNLTEIVRILADQRLHAGDPTLKDLIGPVIQLFSILVVCMTLYLNLLVTRRLKRLDITSDYQKRFDQIMYDARKSLTSGDCNLTDFWLRFWSLQSDQFFYWRWGFIRDEVYLYWLSCRRREKDYKITSTNAEGSIDSIGTYVDEWNTAKHGIPFPAEFRDLVEELLNSETPIPTIMSKAKRTRRFSDKVLSWMFLEFSPKG